MSKITILGAGAWGTAIAKYLCEQNHEVKLWARDNVGMVVPMINSQHKNNVYLRDIDLPPNLLAYTDFEEAVLGAECLAIAVVSHGLKKFLNDNKSKWPRKLPVIILTKGLDNTGKRMSEVVIDELDLPMQQVAVLSGPNLALLFAKGIEASTVISSVSSKTEKYFADIFQSHRLRVYLNNDITGVEIGGAIKNVIAVAAGIVDALYEDDMVHRKYVEIIEQVLLDSGISKNKRGVANAVADELHRKFNIFGTNGDNVKSALIARGLTEISRFGRKIGANESTFSGLSGIGDIIVTACGQTSRNRTFGYKVGKGESPEKVIKESSSVIEGYYTVKAIYSLAASYGMSVQNDLPICEMVHSILYKQKDPKEALIELMNRPTKRELI